jgi:2-succinyl-5-enolpyruvyl-6-hydroxy-3-cyclohexene-1-carboxylate synthase
MRNTVSTSDFDRLFRTRQSVDIAGLAAAYGWQHVLVSKETQLNIALKKTGRVVIEVSL